MYLSIICVLIGFGVSFIFGVLPVFSFVSKGFLVTVENGKFNEAYSLLSSNYQNRYKIQDFIKDMHESGLDQYQDVQWLKTVTDKDHARGYVMGVVTTKQKRKIPLEIEFVQVQGSDWLDKGWRIDNIRIPSETKSEETKF